MGKCEWDSSIDLILIHPGTNNFYYYSLLLIWDYRKLEFLMKNVNGRVIIYFH